MFDIVILTDHRYINPPKRNWYINQVLIEDELLQYQLEKEGLKVTRKDWADKDFDWQKTRYAIFRTTWDYFERFDEFFHWIDITEKKTTFINSSDIIRWNIDKHYLKELQENGINIAPTIFIEQGEKITLEELFKKTKYAEAVIKPCVSGAARHTYRLNLANYHQYENIFQKLLKKEAMLFQEFLHNITEEGEISLILIGGKYTHAVRKIAKKGDFPGQDDHGGTVKKHLPTKEEIIFSETCLRSIKHSPIYARVDIVKDNKNNLSLCELELIEPELWFRNNPNAANLLAIEIGKKI